MFACCRSKGGDGGNGVFDVVVDADDDGIDGEDDGLGKYSP